jgi:hypothetical protein
MRRTVLALLAIVTAIALTPGPASGSSPAPPRSCGPVRLTGSAPVPPPGRVVRQSVSIGDDCRVVTGPVEFLAAPPRAARLASAPFHTYSEMYDCCGILMTALHTDSTAASTTYSTHANREPWDAGWSVRAATGCAADCPSGRYDHHAEFSYRGIFDVTGAWYYNAHDSAVVFDGDGTATCRQTVTLRHSFIGWNWVHGCG